MALEERLSLFRQALRNDGFRLAARAKRISQGRQAPKDLLGVATTPLASAKPMINDRALDISLSFFTHRWDPLIFPLPRTTHSHTETRVVHLPGRRRTQRKKLDNCIIIRRGGAAYTRTRMREKEKKSKRKRETEKGMEICRYGYSLW